MTTRVFSTLSISAVLRVVGGPQAARGSYDINLGYHVTSFNFNCIFIQPATDVQFLENRMTYSLFKFIAQFIL
jgi:hypothetical protein